MAARRADSNYRSYSSWIQDNSAEVIWLALEIDEKWLFTFSYREAVTDSCYLTPDPYINENQIKQNRVEARYRPEKFTYISTCLSDIASIQ